MDVQVCSAVLFQKGSQLAPAAAAPASAVSVYCWSADPHMCRCQHSVLAPPCAATTVQTDVYLEELTDVVPETDNTTQTDAFLERPPTPKFVPAKSGVDAATQIEDGEHLRPSEAVSLSSRTGAEH